MKKTIVFYCASHPYEMIYKLARQLKVHGYKTVLFTMSEEGRFDRGFYKAGFDDIYCSNFQIYKPSAKTPSYLLKRGPHFIKFLLSMKRIKPYAIIGVSGANWQLKYVHRHFFRRFPFIYFPYDILSLYFNSKERALEKVPNFEIEGERYCFEHSDGVLHKGDPNELKFIEGRLHKNLKIPYFQLNFIPPCTKEFIVQFNKNKLSKIDREFHVVFIGGFPTEVESARRMLGYFNDLLKQKIHIHTYLTFKHIPENQENSYLNDFFNKINKSKYFHTNKPVDAKAIISEISRYDFGLWVSSIGNKEDKKINSESAFATGNKLSSYLEAGLPIIYSDELLFADRLLSSFGLKLPFNEESIKTIKKKLLGLNYKQLEKNIRKARKELSLEKQFPRFEKFVREVAESFNKNKEK
jgi:hypothetical protein